MFSLPNGCRRSEISVNPANWSTAKAKVIKNGKPVQWKITYRYYDPAFPTPKRVAIKGMNKFKLLPQRQAATRALLATELELLDRRGYNPITKLYPAETDNQVHEISPEIPFTQGLREGMKKMTVSPDTMTDIESTVRGVEKAAAKLWDSAIAGSYLKLTISQISRKHIKYLLLQCAKDNPRWSNNRYNRYVDNLSMVFKTLKSFEVIESNPTVEVERLQHVPAAREILTDEEILIIEEKLKPSFYEFWRYIRIFHRSGSRTTEMLNLVKGPEIMLEKQEFIVTVKKGRKYKKDIRVIHDEVLPLWREIWDQAKPGEYLFSRGLKPGPKRIRKDQICRRWNRHVKADESAGGLAIKKDFYSLKHLNTDKITEILDIQHAQLADGHTTPVITLNNYAVGEKQRRLDRLKKVATKFGADQVEL